MMIPASPPGMNAEDGAAGLEEPISDAPDVPSAATLAALMVATLCVTPTVPTYSPATRCYATGFAISAYRPGRRN
jgi:hypothetical protein